MPISNMVEIRIQLFVSETDRLNKLLEAKNDPLISKVIVDRLQLEEGKLCEEIDEACNSISAELNKVDIDENEVESFHLSVSFSASSNEMSSCTT